MQYITNISSILKLTVSSLEKIILGKKIQLEYASMEDQIADFLTNAMIKKQLYDVFSKLDIVNIYLPAW